MEQSLRQKIQKALSEKYESSNIKAPLNFANYKKANGVIFHVEYFEIFNAIAGSYAENEQDAKNWMFEDGDLIYLDDYATDEDVIQTLLDNIELA